MTTAAIQTQTQTQHYNGNGPSTPWGRADSLETYRRGIAFVSTPRHGGFRVARSLAERTFPPQVLDATIFSSGYYWFEEDCMAAFVALAFPNLDLGIEVPAAAKVAKTYYPDEYTALTGEPVSLEESWVLRKRQFEEETREKFVGYSAVGGPGVRDGVEVPAGMVLAWAKRASDGAKKRVLVDVDAYEARGEFSYVLTGAEEEV